MGLDPAQPKVFLVGAGPGSPGLLTVRAAEVLARADLVLHDQLVPERLLELAPPTAAQGLRPRPARPAPGQVPAHPQAAHRVGEGRQDGRAAQGRRPAHLRPRRRGGRGAARRGRRLRDRPRRDRGARRRGVPRNPAHPPPPRQRRRPRHRATSCRTSPATGSTGRRSPPSPARWRSTWASPGCR